MSSSDDLDGSSSGVTEPLEVAVLHDTAIPLPATAEPMLPRLCLAGPLSLDLFHRDAHIGGKWLRLFPREFGLLWRLAETPGQCVSRSRLLREVWRLDYEPETNRVAVHIARLRSKLHIHRLGWMVATDPAGGYFLELDGVPGIFTFGPNPVMPIP